PESVAARLDEAQRRIAERNLRLSRALLDVLDLLTSAGIDALPLKGPVLAQQVYGSVAMRVFGDLDVLVAEARIDEALGVLLEAGYVRRLSGASEQESERRHSHHIGLV